jgi:sugar phosphate isomerase/epimerase
MTHLTRRRFIQYGIISGAGWLGLHTGAKELLAGSFATAKFTMDLRCGSIGVRADQSAAIRLASKYGFQSVTPEPNFLARLNDEEYELLLSEMKQNNLVWGAAGLPVDFRRDDATQAKGIEQLPRLAKALQRVGATRIGTWLRPSHDKLTYLANFRQHVKRLRECARILADHDLRLGLEYVGPKTSWTAKRFSFVHTMVEAKELIADIGCDNVGLVLDSWHWYTAQETADDLRTLKNEDIVACDLNDAPAGVSVDQQIDNRRELPAASGVIDLKSFLGVLLEIGYDGPIRAEPFNKILNEMDSDDAVAATAVAMRKAFALVDVTVG